MKIARTFPLILLCTNDTRSNGLECGGVAGVAVVYAGLVFALRAAQCLKLGFLGNLRAE